MGSRGPGGGHRDRQDGVRPQPALVGGAIEIDQHARSIRRLVRGVLPVEGVPYLSVHVAHGVQDAFASIPGGIAVSELNGLVLTRGCPAGNGSASDRSLPPERLPPQPSDFRVESRISRADISLILGMVSLPKSVPGCHIPLECLKLAAPAIADNTVVDRILWKVTMIKKLLQQAGTIGAGIAILLVVLALPVRLQPRGRVRGRRATQPGDRGRQLDSLIGRVCITRSSGRGPTTRPGRSSTRGKARPSA